MPKPSPTFFQSMPPLQPADTQSDRRKQVVEMASVVANQCFDKNGNWTQPSRSADARERIWMCFGLMLGTADDVALADAILFETVFDQNKEKPASRDFIHPFDIFVSNHCIQMLVPHAKKMTPRTREKIESWAKLALNNYPGNRQADLQFHGYNDNMPSKAAMGMILGGEYFNDAVAVEHGLWSLKQLRDMLTRRGMVSEFNSPTYSPLTVANLAEVAKLSTNAEARAIAAQCAERGWSDLLAHFHPPTGLQAGPYTRAYTIDSNGHLSNINFVFWLIFGDRVWPNPLEEIRREPPRVVLHHEGDLFFVMAHQCWLAAYEYALPQYQIDWMNSRTYPFHVIATAERGEGGDNSWSSNEILATTYQAEDFALGTSEGDWGFQADECVLQYRRSVPATGAADVRTGYNRYIINDAVPGAPKSNHNGLFQGEHDYLTEHGLYHTVQQDGVAMVCVSPVLRLCEQPLTKMGCAFILPEHLSAIENIRIEAGHVWLQDGPFQMALRPLGSTDWGRPAALSIEKINRYRMIWMPNYVGPSRTFTRKEIGNTVNGFVLITSSSRTEPFAAFKQRVLSAVVLDYYVAETRTVRYRLGEVELGMSYGSFSDQARYISINGKVVPRPVWHADGLPAERLPFLSGMPTMNDLVIPFETMRAVGAPDARTEIFSDGRKQITAM